MKQQQQKQDHFSNSIQLYSNLLAVNENYRYKSARLYRACHFMCTIQLLLAGKIITNCSTMSMCVHEYQSIFADLTVSSPMDSTIAIHQIICVQFSYHWCSSVHAIRIQCTVHLMAYNMQCARAWVLIKV